MPPQCRVAKRDLRLVNCRIDRGVVSKPSLENIPSTTQLEAVGVTSRKTLICDNFAPTLTCHSKHLHQLGHIIPNIHVTLDISCHFGQCYKRPCFLLVHVHRGCCTNFERCQIEWNRISQECKIGVAQGGVVRSQ